MKNEALIALRMSLATLVLTGLVYPSPGPARPRSCSAIGPTEA